MTTLFASFVILLFGTLAAVVSAVALLLVGPAGGLVAVASVIAAGAATRRLVHARLGW